jgi:hypothetical protein
MAAVHEKSRGTSKWLVEHYSIVNLQRKSNTQKAKPD